MQGMIRRLVWAGVATLTLGSARADDGPHVMDPDRAARLMATCDAELAPRLDRDVFAGADRPGTAIHALALFWTRIEFGVANFNAPRGDLDLIVGGTTDFDICHYHDENGYQLGEYWGNEETRDVSWWVREDRGDAVCLKDMTAKVGADPVRARWFACAEPADNGFMVTYGYAPLGDAPLLTALVTREASGFHLTMNLGSVQEITVVTVFDQNGRPTSMKERSCPVERCPDDWTETTFVYDARGNHVEHRISGPDGASIERIVLELNERGDWISRHMSDYEHPRDIAVRVIRYRD